jgi:leucyl-tRNA---protein transferase
MSDKFLLGVSQSHACSYLPAEQERLLFSLPEQPLSPEVYQWLTDHNFRRSGEQIYRPYCLQCQACQAVRLDVSTLKLNRSQRRLSNKATAENWHWRWQQQPLQQNYFPLYQAYISQRHADGVMYPPEPEHLEQLLTCSWMQVSTLEQYIGDQLVGVLVLDHLPQGLSAVYSFYQPDHPLALGILAVIAGTALCRDLGFRYFYLGYLVSDSDKMRYKSQFRPQHRLIQDEWQTFC